MVVTIPLDKMSIEEKIQVMESIWDNLCQTADNLQLPPQWHEQILNEREESLNQGKDEFIDWEVAKKEIRNNTP